MSGNSTLDVEVDDGYGKSNEGASLPLSVVLFAGLVLSIALAFGLRAVGRGVFDVPSDLGSLATGAILPAAIFPVLGTCFGFFMSFRAKPSVHSMQLFLGIGAALALIGVAISASKLPAAPSSAAVVFTVATSLLPTIGIVAALLVFVPRTPHSEQEPAMRDRNPAGYPRTIDNGAGERLTWLGIRHDDDGREYLHMKGEIEPDAGPPLHIHQLQTEMITVDEGRIGYVIGGGTHQFAGPGETMTFKPGEAHRFWNAGDSVATLHGWANPPLNFEYLLSQTFASTKRNGGTRPNVVEAAYLLGRYRSEFAIADIPKPVQTLVFPLMWLVGKINGVSKRYTDAPPPAAAG